MSIRRQCELIGLSPSSYYYKPCVANQEDLSLMRQIDELYMRYPFYGSRRITEALRHAGQQLNRKRVVHLMRLMGLVAVYPKPRTSQPSKEHKVYPYLLRGVKIQRVNHVWSTDLTYIPIRGGWMYLMAVMDWYSRYVIAWDISNSMDGRGRALDNVFIERLWRSLKYEDIYIKDYATVQELREGLQQYFLFYNTVRQHQALEYRTPLEVYYGAVLQR